MRPMTTAVTYLRVSSADQVQNTSLDDQNSRTKQHLSEKGWTHLATFREEGYSAKTDDRPQLKAMLQYCAENEVDYVVALDMSRVSRDTETFLRIRKALAAVGTKLSFTSFDPGDSPEGIFIATVTAAASELENRLRGLKAKRGMLQTRRAGGWTTYAPKGYRCVRQGRLPTLEPTDEAFAVRRAFEDVASGLKTPEQAGAELGVAKPHAFFRRAVFAGYNDIDGQLVRGQWRPIVPVSTWFRVQERMKHPCRVRHEEFWLRGHLRCECGHMLTASYSKGRTRRYGYYHCAACKARHPAAQLEQRFRDWLGKLAAENVAVFEGIKKETVASYNEQFAEATREESRLQAQIDAISGKLSALVDLKLEGGISAEEYAAKREELTKKRKDLQAERLAGTVKADDFNDMVDDSLFLLSHFPQFLGAAGTECLMVVVRALVGSTTTVGKNGDLSNRESDCLYWLSAHLNDGNPQLATPRDLESNFLRCRVGIIAARLRIARGIVEETLGITE